MKAAILLWVLAATPGIAAPTAAIPGIAAPGTTVLSPATSQIEYTAYALGMFPMVAHFDDFAGTITTDTAPARICHVEVTVRIASLKMADASRTRMALGPSMLDAARFPTMGFSGQCAGATLAGALTLHGITRQLDFTLERQGAQIIATGLLQRRDFAITGMAGLVGQRIRIRLQTKLPTALAAVTTP